MKKTIELTEKECEAIYSVFKARGESPVDDGEYYNDYYDTYEKPIKNKVIRSILNKIGKRLDKDQKEEMDKDFLREEVPYL